MTVLYCRLLTARARFRFQGGRYVIFVDTVALGFIFSEYFGTSDQLLSHQCFRFVRLLSGAGTTGDCNIKGMSLTPLQI